MGFIGNIKQKIDNTMYRWMFKDDINKEKNRQQQLYEDTLKQVEKELDLIINEDHTVKPTDCDIQRYFTYYKSYIGTLRTEDSWIIEYTEDEFMVKCKVGGWGFMRKIVMLDDLPTLKNKN